MKTWRVVSVKRSQANGGVFVANVHEGRSWVARIKSPDESATKEQVEAYAAKVCESVNKARGLT